MRTTEGKGILDVRTSGDASLTDILVTAMAHEARVERATHGFHTYPAGLHPDTASDILRTFQPASVFDPFCGGGTVLVEGMLQGMRVEGSDLGPIARLVSRTRTSIVSDELLTQVRSASRRITQHAREQQGVRPPPEIFHRVADWYAPHVLSELEVIRRGIESCSGLVQILLFGAWSSTLVKVSWQRSDTSSKREVHRRPEGTTATLFHKKTRELARRLVDLRTSVPEDTCSPMVHAWDARQLGKADPVDMVLTSPPYPGVYDYMAMQALREAWLGVRGQVGGEIGSRQAWSRSRTRAQARWTSDTHQWIQQSRRLLRPSGRLVVVVGDGLVHGRVIDSEASLKRSAEDAGLTVEASVSVARPDHARGARRWEHVLVFRAPAGSSPE